MPVFSLQLARKVIEIHAVYDRVQKLCADYLVQGLPPDLVVRTSQADIDAERDAGQWSDDYLETLAVYRRIAEWLPLHNRVLFHGAVVAVQGRGYLFTAPSGTGKTTHVALWKRSFADAVTVVNGDKPILQIPDMREGSLPNASGKVCASSMAAVPVAFGTPWAGKEQWHTNTSVPLAGICFLSRGERNCIERVQPADVFDQAFQQIYLPREGNAAARTLELLDALLAITPLYQLACDVSEEAVRTSFEALTNLDFDEFNQQKEAHACA